MTSPLSVFGALPSATRAERIKRSPNYRDGEFRNVEETTVALPGSSTLKLMMKFFNKPSDTRPPHALPSVKVDLEQLDDSVHPVIVWFGHSSYCIKFHGKTILVDPVFSGHASPFSFFGKAFEGVDVYSANDFGKIDLLVLTHDHYDHLDYESILAIKDRTGKIVTSLGVGAHLEAWGIPEEKIIELDWWESVAPYKNMRLTATPARHFSGRLFKRNQSLWSSFVLEWEGVRLFLGGDSGYGPHFKEIGQKFGPFNLALLESGQYNAEWPMIHTLPEETVKAAEDLKAAALMPVHWAKFALALHPWNEPPARIRAAIQKTEIALAVPKIGEPVTVGQNYPSAPWWAS